MDTATLKQVLLEEMRGYAGEGLNATSHLTQDEAERLYTVVDIATIQGERLVSTVLIARIVGDQVVIELDHNNKELVDALLARGVPRSQISLAYRGDPVPG